jgi:hypothetical protein
LKADVEGLVTNSRVRRYPLNETHYNGIIKICYP